MPRKAPELTGSQIKQIRANIARSASQIGRRLTECALGKAEMNQTQVTAGKAILQHCLPAMQQVEDTTPERTDPHEVKEQLEGMLLDMLADMTDEEMRALLEKRSHAMQ